jgi:aspartate/methionine/tyrosine aminotransferase
MMEIYRGRRDILVDGLNRIPGIRCLKGDGAFYLFPNITGTGMTSDEFAEFAITKARVALLSGNNFGEYGEGYVRVTYANNMERIQEGLLRLSKALRMRK